MYAQLKERLIASVERGDFVPGDQLPSQRVLCERYGMSHMTVRRAINELLHEGLIYAIAGKGLYVADSKQDAESEPLRSFSEETTRRGMKASSKVLTAKIVGASTTLARALSVEVGAQLVYLYRLRLADGAPMALQVTYLPHTLCPGLLEHDLEQGSLFAVLHNVYGLHLAHSTRTVEATLADEQQASRLQLTPPAALLVVEQLTYLDSGQAIEFSRTTYRGDRYRLPLR